METLTIGELSARSGVAPSALRFYEKEGLIHASRTSGNQRRYDRAELRRRIQAALEIYRGAEVRVEALEPPASLRSAHREYLDALRLYYERHRYEVARSADVLAAFEDATGEQLDALFYQWVGEFPGLSVPAPDAPS